MKKVRVCGQCCTPTENGAYSGNAEYSCPDDKCGLVLCPTCSNPEVHFNENGDCPEWWGVGLSETEINRRMQEAAEMSSE